MTQRSHDLVLFGATGFTGKLVTRYLLRKPTTLRVALAGRDRGKLEALRAQLGAAQWPVLVADSGDRAALDAIARDARVVCTTVGPYLRHGAALAASCAANGADYCDLTGEVPFIRRSIEENHEAAQRSGARLVHCCGFDSVPSDLGVLMMHQHAKEVLGAQLSAVTYYLGKMRGGFSGGTLSSIVNLVEQAAQDPALRRLLTDPYALCPGERGPDGPDQMGVRFDDELGAWTGPFLMAGVNTRVVRRSNCVLGYPYGRDFRYREVMLTGTGPKGAARAVGLVAAIGGFLVALRSPLKGLVQRRMTQPGQGPTEQQQREGYFRVRLRGEAQTPAGTRVALEGRVEGDGDPGYSETAKMLSEAALCLAEEERGPGGVLTPAAALGVRYLSRLRGAGMRFEMIK